MQAPIVHPTSLLAYSDSDWGSDASHRRSVTVTITLLVGAAAKYQKAIALSSTEAKFVSASNARKTALYISLLSDLGFVKYSSTRLLVDNTRAVFMLDAQVRTKQADST